MMRGKYLGTPDPRDVEEIAAALYMQGPGSWGFRNGWNHVSERTRRRWERKAHQLILSTGIRLGEHRATIPVTGPDGPEHGHTFEVRVSSRGAYSVAGDPAGRRDAPEWLDDGDHRIRVRAHSLREAMHRASLADFKSWTRMTARGWPEEWQ